MRWIASHEEVQMCSHEIRSLRKRQPAELVRTLYDLPAGTQYKRGYKAPNEISSPQSLKSLYTYFPETKLIVGVRHTVKWMESWWNFKQRHNRERPPAETLVGPKLPYQVQYHLNLAMLGKTRPKRDEHQARLLETNSSHVRIRRRMHNKVFLYDVSQPFDANETRAKLFAQDLSNYIGLSPPLEPLKRRTSQSFNTKYDAIDICDDKFAGLRAELVENGRAASEWIITYFIGHPDVTVSSPDHFKEILSTWANDPCEQS